MPTPLCCLCIHVHSHCLCICQSTVCLCVCACVCVVRQIMSAQQTSSDFNPELPDWAATVQQFVFINIMHIDPLICFHSQISLGVCLSLIHSMIGYLFPIILIQATCPWERWSNRTAMIYICAAAADNEPLSCSVFSALSFIQTLGRCKSTTVKMHYIIRDVHLSHLIHSHAAD